MIRYQEMVPDYYPEKSRDFQVLCRLYDFALNALRYNIDSMQSLTDTRHVKDTILPLTGDKFGIYNKESYSNRHLLEALPIALKYKGSLKAVSILINAFLDSLEVFEYATAFHAKDEESAAELSAKLNRKVTPYSIIIMLSSYPNMTNLHVLDEFLNMVIPSGMIVEYMFGYRTSFIDQFKYKEYTFLFFTNTSLMEDNTHRYQDVSTITTKKFVVTTSQPDDWTTNYYINYYTRTQDASGKYIYTKVPKGTSAPTWAANTYYDVAYRYRGTVPVAYQNDDFTKKVIGDVDVNSVSLASISGAPVDNQNGE